MTATKTPTTQQPNYKHLVRVLGQAYEQAAYGKGRERHANGRDFDKQPIIEYGRIVGPAGTAFQAQKKIGEGIGTHLKRNADREAAIRELLGAIVYAAATVYLIEEEAGAHAEPVHGLAPAFSPPAPPVPSPIKEDGPTIRILEAEWERLREIEDYYNGVPKDKLEIEHKAMREALRRVVSLASENYNRSNTMRTLIGKLNIVGLPAELAQGVEIVKERRYNTPSTATPIPGDGL